MLVTIQHVGISKSNARPSAVPR